MKSYQRKWIVLFLSPALILSFIFTLLPAITLLSYSLFDWKSFSQGKFIGLSNFNRLIHYPNVEQFKIAFLNNLKIFLLTFSLQTALALLISYAIYRLHRGQRFFQVVTFFPVILSLVVVAFMWKMFLDPLFGPVNNLFTAIGFESWAKPWLGDPKLAMPILILIGIWKSVGFSTIVFLAGLNGISEDYLEAARIDGANERQIYFRVIFPLLAPAFTIVTILVFIGSFEWFELPYVIGGVTGQPGGSTTTLALLFYRLAFGTIDAGISDIGLSSAVGVILFLFVGVGAAFGAVYLQRREIES